MSNLSSTYDNDFDSYLNLDSNDYTPISASPAVKAIPSLASQSSAASSSHQSFSGPSYQYDSYRQQTGLPIGGLANTFAVNQATGLHYRPNQMGFVMPTETLNIPLSNNLDDFDFGRHQSFDMSDVDFDADSPSDMPAMFYPGSSSNGESSQSAPIQRMYPGMHSQQAAQAKAAQAQRQQEILRSQQQPKQIAGQRPLPTQVPKAPTAKDPLVEESISRLLNRMRQGSSASIDESSPSASGTSGLIRPKKEEDDMDEDERLLASEEGKKLSSKERRQLRNKVSARAFRSRRKEYIGQLEGEVAAKVQEANELRVQNRQLMDENTRLTDLTRMLLSSQAFSGFLQELSNSGLPAPNLTPTSTSQPTQTSKNRKDVPIHEATRQLQTQNQQHVGMTLVPENTIDMSGLELPNNNWSSLPSNDFQVYSVSALPQPPILDLSALTEKPASLPKASSKDTLEISSLPPPREMVAETPVTDTNIDDNLRFDDAASDLYCDSTSASSDSASTSQILIASISKPGVQAEQISCIGETGTWAQLERMCSELDETCTRLAGYLP